MAPLRRAAAPASSRRLRRPRFATPAVGAAVLEVIASSGGSGIVRCGGGRGGDGGGGCGSSRGGGRRGIRGGAFVSLLFALIVVTAVDAKLASMPIAPASVALVAASACSAGQAQRPCTAMERITGGRTSSSTCPCPYIDGIQGGPGPVRRFTLVVQNTVIPSLIPGLSKIHITANGSIPGPAIVVNAGDWLEITVVNRLPNEPTTLHWHGQLQVMTPFAGGVPSMTQCSIQAGDSLVYTFRASNAGTFWCVCAPRERAQCASARATQHERACHVARARARRAARARASTHAAQVRCSGMCMQRLLSRAQCEPARAPAWAILRTQHRTERAKLLPFSLPCLSLAPLPTCPVPALSGAQVPRAPPRAVLGRPLWPPAGAAVARLGRGPCRRPRAWHG
jgi:hypothetical protein